MPSWASASIYWRALLGHQKHIMRHSDVIIPSVEYGSCNRSASPHCVWENTWKYEGNQDWRQTNLITKCFRDDASQAMVFSVSDSCSWFYEYFMIDTCRTQDCGCWAYSLNGQRLLGLWWCQIPSGLGEQLVVKQCWTLMSDTKGWCEKENCLAFKLAWCTGGPANAVAKGKLVAAIAVFAPVAVKMEYYNG